MLRYILKITILGLIIAASQSLISGVTDISGQAYASEEAKEGGELDREIYVKVPPLAVPMYHKGRPKGNMTITLLIKVQDSEKRAKAIKFLPRLSSAYVIEANRLSHDYFDVNRPVNVAMIGDSFQIATNRILGHKEAKVFLSDVVIQK